MCFRNRKRQAWIEGKVAVLLGYFLIAWPSSGEKYVVMHVYITSIHISNLSKTLAKLRQ